MRFATLILFLISNLGFSQIPMGHFYSYGMSSKGEQFNFMPNQYVELLSGKDTLGGYGNNKFGVVCRYELNLEKNPQEVDFVFSSKEDGGELKRMNGIFRVIDSFRVDLVLNTYGTSVRPSQFNFGYPEMGLKLISSRDSNYIQLLKVNEREGIDGFEPNVERDTVGEGVVKVSYVFPLGNYKNEFQSYEIHKYSDSDLVEVLFYDSDAHLFENQFGYAVCRKKFDENGRLLEERYLNEEQKSIVNTLEYFPKVKYKYKGERLVSVSRKVNNSELLDVSVAREELIYDRFGNYMGVNKFLNDGTSFEDVRDSNKVSIVNEFKEWVDSIAKYPESFKLLKAGSVRPSFSASSGVKTKESEKYTICVEFKIRDELGAKQIVTSDLIFNYRNQLVGIHPINSKTVDNGRYSVYGIDQEVWIKYFGFSFFK